MSVRLVVLLAAVLAGLLYLTVLNTEPFAVEVYPGLELSLPLSAIIMAGFLLGVVSVMLLYFYDTLVDWLTGLKRKSGARRAERVQKLFEAGTERLMMGNKREAEKLFRKALAHDPDHVRSLIALGRMLREDGSVTEAIKLHSRAKGLDETSVSAFLELAEDYVAAEQFANAISVLGQTRSLAGRSLPPLVRIRDVYLKVKNWHGALETQREIVALAPWDRAEQERKMLAALTYEAALAAMAAGKFEEARDGFKAVLRGDDQFIPAYLKLAEAHERLGARKDAVKTLEKGFKTTGSIVIIMALEALLFAWGEKEKAVAELRWAKNMLPGEDVLRLFLAEALLRSGDYTSARREIDSLNGRLAGMTLYHLVEAKARRGENNIDLALESLDEAYQQEVATFFRFICSSCNHMTSEYSGRCRACGAWNTLEPLMC